IEPHNLFYGGWLFQQYVCDAWASVEQSYLTWIVNNQKRIRAELYSGLQDCVAQDPDVHLGDVGRNIVLPSSHSGSQRHMQQLLQDSLAICRDCQRPDIFLTMSANPDWPEIHTNILPGNPLSFSHFIIIGQKSIDCPDLVAHVFFQKEQALLKKVRNGCFGAVAGLVYNIEYQKRGLPHMHLLI
ncbi:hypothetical protein PAXRUDRAFT_124858, partial [Paxillus rubicundulus Ve08.2h10]